MSLSRKLLLLSALAVVLGRAAPCATAQSDVLPGALRDWAARQSEAGAFKVRFQLTRTLPTLKEPVREPGIFWRYPDGRFRWQIGEPPISILQYDASRLTQWESNDGEWRELDPKDRRTRLWTGFLSGTAEASASLSKDFEIIPNGGGGAVCNFSLIPKSAPARRQLKQIDITLDSSDSRLLILRVIQGDDATMQMDFARPAVPDPADAALWQSARP